MTRRQALLLALLGGALASGTGLVQRPARAGGEATERIADPARRVRVEAADRREHRESAVFHGLTRAADRTAVAFTIPGRIVAREVDVGDRVNKGQVLARLDRKPLRIAKSAAEAELRRLDEQLAQQTRDETRAQGLFDDGAATAAQLEKAKSGAETLRAGKAAAQAQLAERGRQLSEAVLRAPFDANVTAAFVDAGQVISPGSPVLQLSGQDHNEVELAVPGRIADRLQPGIEVDVRYSDDAWEPVQGKVERVSLASQGAGALFAVVISLDEDDPAPVGLPVVVELPVAVHERVSVPVAALVDPSGQATHVWVAQDGVVDKRPVRLAGMVGGRVLLESGVEPKESVVVSGLAHLLPGDRVEIDAEEAN